MGQLKSKIDYNNIISISDINHNNPNKFIHNIKFSNGIEKTYKFNKEQEFKFQCRYKFTNMCKPLRNIKYNMIQKIIINNNTYLIIFTDENILSITFNEFEESVFWNNFKILNNEQYNKIYSSISK